MMLFLYIIKMTLISGLLYCYYWFFLRNKQFHHYNRFYLLGIAITAAILPLLKIPVPFSGFGNEQSAIRLLSVSDGSWEDAVTITAHKNFLKIFLNWQYLSFCVYMIGVFIVLIALLKSLSYIIKIARSYPYEKVNDIHFFHTTEPGTPFSFFKKVFWNEKINVESSEGQQIFRHELYHVRQKHSADILLLESISMLTWFNPFIYLIKKEIKAIHEFLADEYAISDSNRYAYAELLVMQSIHNKQLHILNPFFHNQIKRRIAMITKFKNPQKSYLSRLMILPLLFILFCAFAVKTSHKKNSNAKIKQITVVIDAGHGGIDAGAKSATGITEKDIALEISKKIKALSVNYNINVVMTREKDELPGGTSDYQEGLKNRTEIAIKNNASLFISIHLNNTDDPSKSGFQMYISDNNASLLQKNIQLGSILSEQIKKDYAVDDVLIRMNHGVAVLNHSAIPAVIVECGYLTNSRDLAYITDDQNQEKIAKDILEGIVKFSQTNTSTITPPTSRRIMDTVPSIETLNPKDIKEITVMKDKSTVLVRMKNGDSLVLKNVDMKSTAYNGPIFTKVEVEAEFPGGQKGWLDYLNKNLHYPDSAVNKEIQGDVLMEFIVSADGAVRDVKAVSGPEELKSESIRIIRESGKWIPAMNNGQNVTCYRRQPIKYRLERQ